MIRKFIAFFSSLFFLSSMMVIYINLNVRQIQSSYDIRDKEQKIVSLSEEYKQLVFELSELKFPANLEQRVADMQIGLTKPENIRIIPTQIGSYPAFFASKKHQKGFSLLDLDFIQEAHANASQER